VRKEGLQGLVRIEQGDFFTHDLSKATVITTFLYPRLLKKLIPQFKKLAPGSRIVSHHFQIPDVPPDKFIEVPSDHDNTPYKLMLWTTPLVP
jgi:hypothetical protein